MSGRTIWLSSTLSRPFVGLVVVVVVTMLVALARVALATTATIGLEGHLLLDSQPFFPIGIYHVSWIGDRAGGEAIPDLERAADAGFTLFHPTLDGRDSVGDLLDVAAARGVSCATTATPPSAASTGHGRRARSRFPRSATRPAPPTMRSASTMPAAA